MKRYKLDAAIRTGKGRQVRREKLVPAVLYGRGVDTIELSVPESEINQFVQHGTANALIDLTVGQDTYTVMLKDLQRNKLKEEVLHADFYAVDLKEELTTTVPIHLVGEPEGVKAGGVLQYQTREVEVKCLPTEIPQGFDLDISSLEIGHSLDVASLETPQGMEILTPETEVIVSVLAPRLAEEDEAESTEEELEGATEASEPAVDDE